VGDDDGDGIINVLDPTDDSAGDDDTAPEPDPAPDGAAQVAADAPQCGCSQASAADRRARLVLLVGLLLGVRARRRCGWPSDG
jgi:hypothetical protein